MSRNARRALISVIGALALAGCGSSAASPGSTGTTGSASTPTATSAQALFTSAGCAGCHTLAAAKATGSVGPNLDELKPSYAATVSQVTNGGGVMPSFKNSLSKAEIESLAHFIVTATH